MTTLFVRLTLLEPTLVTALDGDPNSLVSYPYVPGSVVRGAFIGAYMRARKLEALDASDAEVRRLFFDGTTCYLNAYPCPNDWTRALPTPRSWFREKYENDDVAAAREQRGEGPIYDLALKDKTLTQPSGIASQTAPFCWAGESVDDANVAGTLYRLDAPRRHIAIHIVRSRRPGRPRGVERVHTEAGADADADKGTLFRYDALAPEQTLVAAILTRQEADADTLGSLFAQGQELSLGAARSAGYGRVHFDVRQLDDAREVGGTLIVDPLAPFTLTLLSHAILRDGWGQHRPTADTLLATVASHLSLEAPLNCLRAYASVEPVGGFNRTWGLPLPQTPALAMGSVFVLSPPAGVDLTRRLAELERDGIGERRAEGFGRVAVNWHRHYTWQEPEEYPEDYDLDEEAWPATPTLGAPSMVVVKRMVTRLLEQDLDRRIVASAELLARRITRPSLAQISRLRRAVQDALVVTPEAGRTQLLGYLKALDRRQTTRQQFTADTMDVDTGERLLSWLKKRVEDTSGDIWNVLGVDRNQLPGIGAVIADLPDGLAYRYNLRLLDEVLALAAKRIQQVRQQEGSDGR